MYTGYIYVKRFFALDLAFNYVSIFTINALSLLVGLSNMLYCKPINIRGYLIWRILTSGYIDCYLNWLILEIISMSLIEAICIGGYLIWRFLGSSQISQFKSPPNINGFAVFKATSLLFLSFRYT